MVTGGAVGRGAAELARGEPAVGGGAQHEGGPAGTVGRERAEPERGLDDVPVDRDPLGLRVVGQAGVRDARTDLDAERRDDVAQGPDGVERGSVRGGVEDARARARAAHRVGVDAVDALGGQVEGEPVGTADLGLGEGPEVVRGEGRGRGIEVRREDAEPHAREGERVGAEAAGEVGHPGDARREVALRVAGGDHEARGLLEALGREQHAVGERAELRACLVA